MKCKIIVINLTVIILALLINVILTQHPKHVHRTVEAIIHECRTAECEGPFCFGFSCENCDKRDGCFHDPSIESCQDVGFASIHFIAQNHRLTSASEEVFQLYLVGKGRWIGLIIGNGNGTEDENILETGLIGFVCIDDEDDTISTTPNPIKPRSPNTGIYVVKPNTTFDNTTQELVTTWNLQHDPNKNEAKNFIFDEHFNGTVDPVHPHLHGSIITRQSINGENYTICSFKLRPNSKLSRIIKWNFITEHTLNSKPFKLGLFGSNISSKANFEDLKLSNRIIDDSSYVTSSKEPLDYFKKLFDQHESSPEHSGADGREGDGDNNIGWLILQLISYYYYYYYCLIL